MVIKRKIMLNDIEYYIIVDCIYKNECNSTFLRLKNYNDNYYDEGDLSLLIKKLEQKYNYDVVLKKYNSTIPYMNNVLYIYDNIPFISGIGDIFPMSESYITKTELDIYISEKNIKMNDKSKFKLSDERTWYL